MQKILIIEDDLDLQEGLSFSLETDGYKVTVAGSKKGGLGELEKLTYDLILLDCNLPDGNGFDICTHIRKNSDVPILMLTARDSEIDEVKALELGVDDYMSKPFSIAVLKARIKKLLQRRQGSQRLESNGILLDKSSCRVYKREREIPVSKVEYKLLFYLMENKNQVLSKEQLLEYIWDCEGKFVDENTLSVNVRRLRTKIEDNPSEPVWIKTVHGLGYVWKAEDC